VVTERQLAVNMGVMNLAVSFFGGMPMCHGAGGLAGQYYFGARTGGANIIEGTIEIVLGVFFAASIATAFAAFPGGILGAMMLAVGVELLKFGRDLPHDRRLATVLVTIVMSVAFNMAWGFAGGILVHRLLESFRRGR
jgi:MFS superfamily sulfate permease-like transporter